MKKKLGISCLLPLALCLLLLAGCRGGDIPEVETTCAPETAAESAAETVPEPETALETEAVSEPGSEADQGLSASTGAPGGSAGALQPSSSERETADDSAYQTGSYMVDALGEDQMKREQLFYEDGVLVSHYYSDPSYGKGSYGPDGSDELQYSPFYQKSIGEAISILEEQGLTVTVQPQ